MPFQAVNVAKEFCLKWPVGAVGMIANQAATPDSRISRDRPRTCCVAAERQNGITTNPLSFASSGPVASSHGRRPDQLKDKGVAKTAPHEKGPGESLPPFDLLSHTWCKKSQKVHDAWAMWLPIA